MTKYVVRDQAGNLQVVGANGFVPQGAVCLAPVDANFDDGDLIDIVESGGVASAVINQSRKATKAQALATIQAAQKAEAEAVVAKIAALKALKGKSLTTAEIKTAVEALLLVLINKV